jgi:hypothetical protein
MAIQPSDLAVGICVSPGALDRHPNYILAAYMASGT